MLLWLRLNESDFILNMNVFNESLEHANQNIKQWGEKSISREKLLYS